MDLTTSKTVAAIEAGGTKFVVAIGRGDQIGPRATIPTTDPNTTLSAVVDAIKTELDGDALNAIGIASFGPIDIDKQSQTYGEIGATPKAGWAGVNLQSYFSQAFGCPIGIESDVNGAALAEAHWDGQYRSTTWLMSRWAPVLGWALSTTELLLTVLATQKWATSVYRHIQRTLRSLACVRFMEIV